MPVGCIGVWEKPLQPGQYYLNPRAFTIIDVDTRAQVWTYGGGYTRAQIALVVDAKGEIVQKRSEVEVPVDKDNADKAVLLKMEGWDVPLELRVVAQVAPNDAACVVAGIGALKEVEDRVLTPSIRAITRDVAGGTYEVTEAKVDENGKPVLDKDGKPIIVTVNRPTKVLDLINQRPLIESEIERRIRPEGRKSCVTIREVRLGEPAIPPELLVAVRREQLATQLGKAFIQEQAAQQQRVSSEKAKATADQQVQLVQAEIEVQRSVQLAQAARNSGEGERDKLAAIAEGQKKQMDVLGLDATVKLRQFELVMQFAQQHPEVVAAMFNNAHKFVPQVTVGQGGDGIGGMLSALVGEALGKAETPPPIRAWRSRSIRPRRLAERLQDKTLSGRSLASPQMPAQYECPPNDCAHTVKRSRKFMMPSQWRALCKLLVGKTAVAPVRRGGGVRHGPPEDDPEMRPIQVIGQADCLIIVQMGVGPDRRRHDGRERA